MLSDRLLEECDDCIERLDDLITKNTELLTERDYQNIIASKDGVIDGLTEERNKYRRMLINLCDLSILRGAWKDETLKALGLLDGEDGGVDDKQDF